MPKVYYETQPELSLWFEEFLNRPDYGEFESLRNSGLKLSVFYAVAASEEDDADGEYKPAQKEVVVVKKVPPIFKANSKDDADIIISIDFGEWDALHQDEREVKLHTALSSIDVKVADNGDVKIKSKKPDVVAYSSTVRRYGVQTSSMQRLRELMSNTTQAAKAPVAAKPAKPAAPVAEAPRKKAPAVIAAPIEDGDDDDKPEVDDGPEEEPEQPPVRKTVPKAPAKPVAETDDEDNETEARPPVRRVKKQVDPDPEPADLDAD